MNPSTVSRWETGVLPASHLTLTSYESVLELPPNSLVAVVDNIQRLWAPTIAAPPALARRTHRANGYDATFEDLLDRAIGTGGLAGSDWDAITLRLATAPGTYLPRPVWERLTQRLLSELMIADRQQWMQRREAYQRILGHPVGQAAAIDSCSAVARDTTGQMFIEAVSILDCSGHPSAASAVLAQLEHPTNSGAQHGALQASVRKLRFGHFTPHQQRRIRAVVDDLRRAGQGGDDVLAVIDQLNGIARASAAGSTEPAWPRQRDTVVGRIADATFARTHAPEAFTDTILPKLIGETLYSTSSDVRLASAEMLAASPYRAAFAAELATEISAPRLVIDQPTWAETLLETLRLVGGPAELATVQRLAAANGIPSTVARAAAISLGHVGGQIELAYWSRAFGKYATLWRRHRRNEQADLLHALVYSAGTLGATPVLSAVRRDIDLPSRARTAAAWWLDLPREVTAGARH